MTAWTVLPDERMMLYAPIGLKLIDDHTGQAPGPFRIVPALHGPPRGNAVVTLSRVTGTDRVPVDVAATLTPSTVLAYPGLGRDKTPATTPPTDYEITIDADRYRPLYRATDTGVRFTSFPYNDDNPPAVVPSGPVETRLLPNAAYPYPAYVPVLRGQVVDAAAVPVVDALVSATVTVNGTPRTERTLSDDGGWYALALRWSAEATPTTVTADHTPPGGPNRTGSIIVTLPADLIGGQTITIT